jgi:poly(glycerol-phosphate) alpha-glucosyltransferase
VLLFLGRLHPKKNVHGLLAALAQIKSNGGLANWKTVIAGWDQAGYAAQLAELVRELALDDDVLFLGPVYGASKDAVLRNTHAFVLPSFSEGLPMAVLEAWAYGLPVAMTQACNLPEGFNAGAAHEIGAEPHILPHDLAAFLAFGETEHSAMGKRGLDLVCNSFSWSEVARRFTAVYNWMLCGGSAPDCLRAQ